MSEHVEWQRRTSIRKVEEDQRVPSPPPLAQSIAAAARYVGASSADVERWWRGRGR
jgi:hypothetical protein